TPGCGTILMMLTVAPDCTVIAATASVNVVPLGVVGELKPQFPQGKPPDRVMERTMAAPANAPVVMRTSSPSPAALTAACTLACGVGLAQGEPVGPLPPTQ